MSAAPELYGRGPYTIEDLDALPEEGKRFELVHGWLIPMSPDVRHDESAEMVKEIIADAVRASGADLSVRGPWDVLMPDRNIYVPDIAVISRSALRAGFREDARAVSAADVLLAVEIIRPGSGSEKTVRQVKRIDYAAAGIPSYWIVELQPRPSVTVLDTDGRGSYREVSWVVAGSLLRVGHPIPITFDPARLLPGTG
jgi:Uma2 family endonuclease